MKTEYTYKEASEILDISIAAVKRRTYINRILYNFRKLPKGGRERVLSNYDLEIIADESNLIPTPEVIYVTRTIFVMHSSLEFLDYHECLKSVLEAKKILPEKNV